jgi:hypothetical protein
MTSEVTVWRGVAHHMTGGSHRLQGFQLERLCAGGCFHAHHIHLMPAGHACKVTDTMLLYSMCSTLVPAPSHPECLALLLRSHPDNN